MNKRAMQPGMTRRSPKALGVRGRRAAARACKRKNSVLDVGSFANESLSMTQSRKRDIRFKELVQIDKVRACEERSDELIWCVYLASTSSADTLLPNLSHPC